MPQNAAFLPYGATTGASVGPALVTVTLANSVTGLPATAVRLWNNGTAGAFIMIGTGTTLTTTGSAANGLPIPQSIAPFVLRTGGVGVIQLSTLGTSTNTTTIYATGGEGIS